MTLRQIVNKLYMRVWTEFYWLKMAVRISYETLAYIRDK
jgi:hypothetical protein